MTNGFARKLVIGIVGIGIFVLAIGSTVSVGAAAPVGYPVAYTGCAVGYACAGDALTPYGYASIPRDATYYPGVGYAYKDNRYCGDGNVIFTGTGYVCANGSPLYATNGYALPYAAGVVPYSVINTAPGTVLVPANAGVPLYYAR